MAHRDHRKAARARIEAARATGPAAVLEAIAAGQAHLAEDIPYLRKLLARLRGEGRVAETIPVLTALCRTYPGKPGLGMDLGQSHLALGNAAAAERAFAEVVARNPAHGPAWLGQIEAALARPDPARAVRHAEAALAILPRDPEVVQACARVLLRNGRRAAARDGLEAALSAPDGAGHAGMTMTLAGVQRAMGAFEAADTLYRDLLVSRPGHAGAWTGRIQIALTQGDVDRALGLSAEASALCPDKPVPQRLRAEALRRAGRDGEAAALLETLHARWPADTPVAIALGKACLRAGRLDAADGHFRRVLENDPQNWPALQGRVDIAEARGDFDLALALLETGLTPEETDVPISL